MSVSDVRTEVRRWWGERWAEQLEAVAAGAARAVQRGQALARRGAVEDLQVVPGSIDATVAEDRVSPYRVALRWPLPTDAAWDRGVRALGTELRHTAALLDDSLSEELVDTLSDAGVELLPRLDDLEPACSCREAGPICRHVAAVHVAAGVQIDRDPRLLLRLRGRSRDELLGQLRHAEAETLSAPDLDLGGGLERARGDLDAIELRPAPVQDPAALMRHLGPPPGVDDPRPLEALIERAAAAAWRLAAGDGAAAADEELLLAELRAQRTGSAASLAEALGREPEAVREELDALFESGAVLRTGSGDRARYRAAYS